MEADEQMLTTKHMANKKYEGSKADKANDKRLGLKEGSKADNAMDKRMQAKMDKKVAMVHATRSMKPITQATGGRFGK